MTFRAAGADDVAWVIERARQRHAQSLQLGEFDNASAREVFSDCDHVLVDGSSVICGMQVPVFGSSKPDINYAVFWETKGNAWCALDAHEAQSDLPSALHVPWKHERREALMRAMTQRGYAPHEILMVNHG